MGFDPNVLTDRLVSLAATLGVFDRINEHPYGSPGTGITCAVWNQFGGPARGKSGLAATSLRFEYMMRLQHRINTAEPDLIDPKMLTATSELMEKLSGDFDLGETVKHVDLLGNTGEPLHWQAAFVEVDENTNMRVILLLVPLVMNDVFAQSK